MDNPPEQGHRGGRSLILMTDKLGEAMNELTPDGTEPVQALTIATEAIARPIVALDLKVLTEIHSLVRIGSAMQVTDAATFDRGDEVNRKMRKYIKALNAQRVKVKAPVLDLGRRIDAVTKEAVKPLVDATDRLSGRLVTFQRAEEAKVRKAEEARREAERIAQEAEQAAVREAVTGDAEKAVEHMEEAAAVREEAAAEVPTAVKSSSVHETTRQVLAIDDAMHIPQQVTTPTGETIQLWTLNEPAVRRALMAGATVPGAHLEKKTGYSSARQG